MSKQKRSLIIALSIVVLTMVGLFVGQWAFGFLNPYFIAGIMIFGVGSALVIAIKGGN